MSPLLPRRFVQHRRLPSGIAFRATVKIVRVRRTTWVGAGQRLERYIGSVSSGNGPSIRIIGPLIGARADGLDQPCSPDSLIPARLGSGVRTSCGARDVNDVAARMAAGS